jgi:hypothetical protein
VTYGNRFSKRLLDYWYSCWFAWSMLWLRYPQNWFVRPVDEKIHFQVSIKKSATKSRIQFITTNSYDYSFFPCTLSIRVHLCKFFGNGNRSCPL